MLDLLTQEPCIILGALLGLFLGSVGAYAVNTFFPALGQRLASAQLWLALCWASCWALGGRHTVLVTSFQHALPNPSVKRTANGGLRYIAPAGSAAPLSAAYLKR